MLPVRAEAICLGMMHLEGRESARNMDFPVIKVHEGLSCSVKESIYKNGEPWKERVLEGRSVVQD